MMKRKEEAEFEFQTNDGNANKFLSIPLNAVGAAEYDYGVLESNNLLCLDFLVDELVGLFKDGVIDKINEECDLAIDDYESEQIPKDKIDKVLVYVSEDKYPVFYNALCIAKRKGLFLAVDF